METGQQSQSKQQQVQGVQMGNRNSELQQDNTQDSAKNISGNNANKREQQPKSLQNRRKQKIGKRLGEKAAAAREAEIRANNGDNITPPQQQGDVSGASGSNSNRPEFAQQQKSYCNQRHRLHQQQQQQRRPPAHQLAEAGNVANMELQYGQFGRQQHGRGGDNDNRQTGPPFNVGPGANNRRSQYGNQHQRQFRFYNKDGRGQGFDAAMRGRSFRAKERIDHAGIAMSGQISDCHICCQRSDIFALGECMHPICMECALRIRIIGECRQCPQCRTEIPVLYFVCAPPGQKLLLRLPTDTIERPLVERKYGVRFESEYAANCFDAYMANRCQACAKQSGKQAQNIDYGTFSELRAHMAQAHQLSFCHICCEHLNVLCKDRRVYTREQLQHHMNGKLANERDGFRGHPTCQFCEQRFYDDEEHYRHLRKEHYYCQFCDQDGREQNVFYKNQHQLNQHNRRMHHACSDPECLHMGIVFRTDVELDVHRAKQHSRLAQSGSGGGGGSARAGTMIPLDIRFSHTPRFGGSAGGTIVVATNTTGVTDENAGPPAAAGVEQRSYQPTTQVVRIVPSAQAQSQKSTRIVRSSTTAPFNANEFPGLPAPTATTTASTPYGAPPGWTPPTNVPPPSLPSTRPLSVHSNEQFPTLGGRAGGSTTATGKNNSSKQSQNTIWGQKSNKELFAPKLGSEITADGKKEAEQPKRAKFVAAPECWPEHMMEKLKAREQGLPDPDPIKPPNWLNPTSKKEKKRKSKTVAVASAASKLVDIDLVPSSSKFKPLAAYDENNEQDGAEGISQGKKNWWSADGGAQSHVKLAPSSTGDPDFVQIQLVGSEQRLQPRESPPTVVANEASGEGKQKQQSATKKRDPNNQNSNFEQLLSMLEPPPGFATMHTIIQNALAEPGPVEQKHDVKPVDLATAATEESTSSSTSIIHLTMRSIASALFGGGGTDDADNDANSGRDGETSKTEAETEEEQHEEKEVKKGTK